MTTLLILIGSLIADMAVGMAAWKMAKSNALTQASNTATSANLLNLITKHDERLIDHEIRIIILEKKVG